MSSLKSYKVGIVGASGAVGQELLKVLEQRHKDGKFVVTTITLFGSSRSAGTQVTSVVFGDLTVQLFQVEAVRAACDVVFLAVSGSFALEHAKALCQGDDGPVVIDNSSAFRYDPEIPLVVPEINGNVTTAEENSNANNNKKKKLIANPNCTTAIGVMAIAPLAQTFGLKRLLMSTYQAASGAGQPGMEELIQGTKDQLLNGNNMTPQHSVFAHPLPFNVIPHIDAFQENGYTKEEMKVAWETRKICRLAETVKISCTAVRIPTLRAHSEVIVMETEHAVDLKKARRILEDAPGIDVVDDPSKNQYPMPLTAAGQYNVQVGRLRESLAFGPCGLEFFVCGDQLLRGAALNAVLIAEAMQANGSL